MIHLLPYQQTGIRNDFSIFLLVFSPLTTTLSAYVWLTGSVYGASWPEVRALGLWWLVLLLPLAGLARHAVLAQLDDDLARGLGVRLQVQRAALLALAVGCAVLGFGISVEVAPRVLMVPGEGIVQAIAVVTGRQFGNVKTAFDATLVSTALLLSLLFFHQLQGLEIGTIFSALAVGRFVNLYNRRLPLISRISALGART